MKLRYCHPAARSVRNHLLAEVLVVSTLGGTNMVIFSAVRSVREQGDWIGADLKFGVLIEDDNWCAKGPQARVAVLASERDIICGSDGSVALSNIFFSCSPVPNGQLFRISDDNSLSICSESSIHSPWNWYMSNVSVCFQIPYFNLIFQTHLLPKEILSLSSSKQ